MDKQIYATVDLDGINYVGIEGDVSKGDTIYSYFEGEVLLYKISKLNDTYPKLYLDYYFNSDNVKYDNIIELRRVKYTDIGSGTEGKFNYSLTLDGELIEFKANNKLSKNQTILVNNKPVKITNMIKGDDRFTFTLEVINNYDHEFEPYYDRKGELYKTFGEALMA